MNRIDVLLRQILNNTGGLNFFAPFAFMLIYSAGTVLFVPTVVLNLAAGALFEVPMGFAVAMFSSLAAASGAFLAGRYWSRGWLLKKIASNKKIRAIDDAVSEKGWKIVLLLRLAGMVPFTLLNYGLGLSKISFKHYILASLAGMVPGTLLYVYLGSLTAHTQKTPAEWALIGCGIAATVGMGVYSASIVKKALRDT